MAKIRLWVKHLINGFNALKGDDEITEKFHRKGITSLAKAGRGLLPKVQRDASIATMQFGPPAS